MKLIVLALLLLIPLGCGGSADERAPGNAQAGSSPETLRGTQESRAASIYASVIRQLVTKDHTFGGGDPGFEIIYVLDGPVEDAQNPEKSVDGSVSREPFSDAMRADLRAALTDLPPLEFVRERDTVVIGTKSGSSPGHVRSGGVLLSLGPIQGSGTRVEVGNNLWINGLAGQWQTYVVEASDGTWKVTGTTGPVAIS